jgi:hypothetical protein
METVKYNQKQELAVSLGKINEYFACSLRKIEVKELKMILAEVINKSLKNFYRKIRVCRFKKWEIIHIFNFLLNFYEEHYQENKEKTLCKEKPEIENWNERLDVSEQKLNNLYNESAIIHYELSRSLRNISPRNVLPKKTLAKIVGISLVSYHRKANNKKFTTNELIKIFDFLVCFFHKVQTSLLYSKHG